MLVFTPALTEKTKKRFRSAIKKIYGKRFYSVNTGIGLKKVQEKRYLRRGSVRTGARHKKFSKILIYAAYAAAGLVLGSAPLPFSVYPCGTALILSATGEKYAFFSYLGAAVASIGYGGEAGAFFAVNTLAFFARAFLSSFMFNETAKNRIALSAALSLMCGAIMIGVGGFGKSYILRGVSYAVSLPATVICLSSLMSSGRRRRSVVLDGGFCAAAFLGAYALSFVKMELFMPSIILTTVITLYSGISGGSLYGLLMGLLCGAAAGFGTETSFAIAAGTAGFFSGSFGKKKNSAAALCFICVFSAVMLYIDSSSAYTAILSAGTAALLFIPISEITPLMTIKKRFPEYDTKEPVSAGGFEKISRAFTSLSDIVYNISDKLRYPTETEIRDKVHKILDSCCGGCAMYDRCYSRKLYESENVEDIICERLSSGGLKKSDLPDKYAESCIKLTEIVEKFNDGYGELVNEHFRDNKTEILASEYSTMARLIKYTSQKAKIDKTPDRALYDAANSALASIGLRYSSLEAYGDRIKIIDVHGVSVEKFPCTSEELAGYMSEKCGYLFGEPEYIGCGEKMTMRLTRKRKIKLEYARSACAKGGNAVNGDTVSFFESDEDYFYALISDGMGSGRSAALTSRLTSVFIEKLLTTGAHKNVTLELLNNLLLSKNDESFATVDLLEVDLLSGDASFIKAGAAPAYIVRASKLYKIASYTPPAGIIRSFSAESTKFTLEKGDTVLMLSDGIVQSSDEVPWLCEMLSFGNDEDPAKLADKILSKAKKINLREDDMTCVAVKVI